MEKPIINILMVDDRPENLQALEAIFESSNYQLTKAFSGEEALKCILKDDFAVILLDVQMPGLDGFETAKLIRARKKSSDIPIIFITALAQTQEFAMSGYSAGAMDFLFKPVNPFILKSKVEGFVQIYLSQWHLQKKNEIILKRSEQLTEAYSQLKRSKSISSAISETSIDTIFTMNKDGDIITANPSATTMFGYERDEFTNISQLIPMFQKSPFEDNKLQKIYEAKALKKDQKLFPVEIQLNAITLDDDHETIFVCSIRDITERKNQMDQLEFLVQHRTLELMLSNRSLQKEIAEKQHMVQLLKDSEAKYRQLVEASPEAIIVYELHDQNWSFINQTGITLLGGTCEEDILSKAFITFIHPDDQDAVTNYLENIDDEKRTNTCEKRFVRLDGDIIHSEVTIIPFYYSEKPSVHIVIRDITEFKKTQEYIIQSEKLSLAGELAAGIAHEIRNPLTSLRGFTQLLNFKDDTSNPYIPIMLTEIDRINTIVSELLLLSKPKQEDFNKVNIMELIHSSVILMNAQANLHNIEIHLHIEIEKETTFINGLENKLKQVFINLLKNAIEAMNDGGEITLTVKSTDNNLYIELKDQGCGIPPEYLEKIGQPFFTTKDQGTGLGLMVCNSIIESHKGHMYIQSELEIGTTITLEFPNIYAEHNNKSKLHT
jgi:two-component system, sporulation sensor kinase E